MVSFSFLVKFTISHLNLISLASLIFSYPDLIVILLSMVLFPINMVIIQTILKAKTLLGSPPPLNLLSPTSCLAYKLYGQVSVF